MLLAGSNFARHVPWLIACLVGTAVASVWYWGVAWTEGRLPGGSSVPGFWMGVVGAILIVFECLLWVRRRLRAWRLGRARTWLLAHIWLGLLTVPLIVYHSGFRFGSMLTTVVLLLFLVVIVSGVIGLSLQQFLPAQMLHEVPAETIASQIDMVMAASAREAERLVEAVCGTAAGGDTAAAEEGRGFLTLGVLRSAGQVQGKVMQTVAPDAPVAGAAPLRGFFADTVAPYLLRGSTSGSRLQYPAEAAKSFRDLRAQLDPAAHDAVTALEQLCDQRRQLDLQAWLHWWLHSWLLIHLPLSAALLVLMVVHVWTALEYW